MKVICVGHAFDRDYYNIIRERVRSYNLENNIIFTEFIPEADLISLYKESNAFLLPSLFEGWSISVMEAMFFGLPLILTDVGSSRDIIIDNDIGLIIPNSYGDIVNLNYSNFERLFSEEIPKNKDDLKKAMIEFFENRKKWKKNGEKGIEKLANYYSIDETIKTYEQIFTSVCKKTSNYATTRPVSLDGDVENDCSSEMIFKDSISQKCGV
jgi:glycosyltransferase involved in cell wall biosynthesis